MKLLRSLLKILLFAFCTVMGAMIFRELMSPPNQGMLVGAVIGFFIAAIAVAYEKVASASPPRVVLGGAFGAILGLLIANLLSYAFLKGWFEAPRTGMAVYAFVNVLFGYLGAAIGARKGREFDPAQFTFFSRGKPSLKDVKILDTSVIIDGRIADLCETGFIEGSLVIPQFILHELQKIADSSDPLKRAKGRRGLDILNRIQKQVDIDVKITDQDFPRIRDVDSKLIALAKEVGAKIITNDFNLNKVAELHGVTVLNINQLANALKPVVLPGEVMKVQIIKEGKEQGQGIGYLDDGTMVVVDSAKKYLGKQVEVSVTSVLQTTAGRMIFTVLKDNGNKEAAHPHNHR